MFCAFVFSRIVREQRIDFKVAMLLGRSVQFTTTSIATLLHSKLMASNSLVWVASISRSRRFAMPLPLEMCFNTVEIC